LGAAPTLRLRRRRTDAPAAPASTQRPPALQRHRTDALPAPAHRRYGCTGAAPTLQLHRCRIDAPAPSAPHRCFACTGDAPTLRLHRGCIAPTLRLCRRLTDAPAAPVPYSLTALAPHRRSDSTGSAKHRRPRLHRRSTGAPAASNRRSSCTLLRHSGWIGPAPNPRLHRRRNFARCDTGAAPTLRTDAPASKVQFILIVRMLQLACCTTEGKDKGRLRFRVLSRERKFQQQILRTEQIVADNRIFVTRNICYQECFRTCI